MRVDCFQIRFLQIFLLLTFVSKTAAVNSVIHKSDLALDFDEDGCAPPWTSLGSSDNCYLRGDKTMTWEEGWDFCENHGGHLLEVDSEREHLDLTSRTNNIII